MTCAIDGCKNACMFDSTANVIGDYCRTHYDRRKFKEVLSAAAMSQSGMTFDRRKAELADYHTALMRGRHPRSYPVQSALWSYVRDGEKVIKGVRCKKSVLQLLESKQDVINSKDIDSQKKNFKSTVTQKTRFKALIKMVETTKWMENREAYHGLNEDQRNLRRKKKITKDFEKLIASHMNKDKQRVIPGYELPVSVSPTASPKNRPKIHSNTTVTIRATDFNSIKGTKIFYGSMVALELVSEGTWLTVGDNKKCFKAKFRNRGAQYVYKLVDLREPHAVRPINFDDDVWLCAIGGHIGPHKSTAQVVGTKMRGAINLIDQKKKEKSPLMEKIMGTVVPIDAHMLKEREFAPDVVAKAMQMNEKPLATAKWRMRRGAGRPKGFFEDGSYKEPKEQIYNLCEVRIDHDWYYLAAQKGKDEDVILRRLPTEPTPFAQATESSGLWRLHLVQPRQESTKKGGIQRGIQELENILYAARKQLKVSKAIRNGSKEYMQNLVSGSKFSKQMRTAKHDFDLTNESKFLKKRKLKRHSTLQNKHEILRRGHLIPLDQRPYTSDGNERRRLSETVHSIYSTKNMEADTDIAVKIRSEEPSAQLTAALPFTAQVVQNREKIKSFSTSPQTPLQRAMHHGTIFERQHRLLKNVENEVKAKFARDQKSKLSLLMDSNAEQIKKLEPELQIYRAQDQQILDLIVHIAEEEQQEKQADVTEDSDVDVVQVVATSIAPNI